MPEEPREITSPVASNVKNPPWGTEPDTPATGMQLLSIDSFTKPFRYSIPKYKRVAMTRLSVVASVQIDPPNCIVCLLIYFAASGIRKKQFPWTTYSRDYVGATVTPAYPQR